MRAAAALARRELVKFLRQPSRVVGAVAPPLLAWVLIGSGFGVSFRGPGSSEGYLSYFYPGTVVLVVLFASIFSTISVIEDRREGFLQGVLVSPARPSSIALGKIFGGTILGIVQGAAILLLAPAIGLPLFTPSMATAFGVLALVSFALTGLGFAIAWSLDSTQGFHAIMNLFLIPMWLLSGAFFPASAAPVWLRAAIAVNPLTYGVAALRRGLTPEAAANLPSFSTSLGVTVAFGIATLALSAAIVSRFPAGPSRTK
ncbi:MAG TPA: ABC transporter permease [Thermoanaerobaculia bacterium]|jgi:ABC-2 type transport system permease protein|nr:ABC transporter permease [Thermoanaerobaculia bacterium]